MAKDKSMGNSHTAGWKILKGNTKKWSKSLEEKYFIFFSLIMAAKREFQKFSLKCSDLFQSSFSENWCCLKDDCTGLVIE